MRIRFRMAAMILADHEIWPVAILTVGSVVSSRLLPLAVMTGIFLWFARWAGAGRLTVRSPVDMGILLLVLMIPVSFWATIYPEITVPQLYRLMVGILLFYAILNWSRSSAQLRWAMYGLLAGGLVLAISAPVSVQWAVGKLPFIPSDLYQRFTLLVSDTVHPNVLAGNLVILLPLPIAWLLFGWQELNRLERLLAGFSGFGMLLVLALTQSRGSWIAFGIAAIVLISLRWRWGWLCIPASVIVGTGLVYIFGANRMLDALAGSTTLGGLEGRIEVWSRAIYMIQDFPFTGVGMGNFGQVADLLYPFFLYAPGRILHAHNLFLQVAVDLGLPGLVAWMSVLGGVTIISWRLYRLAWRKQDGWMAGVAVGLLCSQAALFVHGMTDAVTWGMVRPAPLVWALWGVIAASQRVFLFSKELHDRVK